MLATATKHGHIMPTPLFLLEKQQIPIFCLWYYMTYHTWSEHADQYITIKAFPHFHPSDLWSVKQDSSLNDTFQVDKRNWFSRCTSSQSNRLWCYLSASCRCRDRRYCLQLNLCNEFLTILVDTLQAILPSEISNEGVRRMLQF